VKNPPKFGKSKLHYSRIAAKEKQASMFGNGPASMKTQPTIPLLPERKQFTKIKHKEKKMETIVNNPPTQFERSLC